jgi:ABC-type multidrug transport system fused ATPase/permease subunit
VPDLHSLQDDDFDELGRPKKIKRDLSDWYVLKRIVGFVGKGQDRKRLYLLLAISICGAILNFFFPLFIREIVDVGLGGGIEGAPLNAEVVRINVIRLGFIMFLSIFFWFGQAYIVHTLANRAMYELRKDLFEQLQRLSFDFYNAKNRSVGKIISYMTNDVETLQELISSGLLGAVGHIFSLFASLTMMIIISWKLTLVSFLLIPFILLVAVTVFKRARQYFILMRRKVAAVTGQLNESITGMRVIKGFAVEENDYKKFDLLTDAELAVNLKAQKLFSAIPAIVIVIIGFGLAIVLIFGAYLNINEDLGAGSILAFILYLIGFMEPLMHIMNFFSQIQNSTSAGERIIKVIETPPTVDNKPDAKPLPPLTGSITFKDVNFEYEKGLPIIRDFTLDINSKERIAIIGYTGAGKTTIINLVCRFYDVTNGSILIDEIDLRDATMKSLRSQIGLVLQDNLLFSGSVKDNIRYGKPNATDEEIINAAKKVGAHEYILDLPNGYDSEVREFGNLLSVGQKQLIAFARALLIDPPILILDEATSAVDPYSELVIQQALETLLKNRTSISIAHRLSTIVNSDRIIVMEHGKIVEEGNHHTLMEKQNGMYRHLFLMQFKDPFKERRAEKSST